MAIALMKALAAGLRLPAKATGARRAFQRKLNGGV
jgi:hypothetical protein